MRITDLNVIEGIVVLVAVVGAHYDEWWVVDLFLSQMSS